MDYGFGVAKNLFIPFFLYFNFEPLSQGVIFHVILIKMCVINVYSEKSKLNVDVYISLMVMEFGKQELTLFPEFLPKIIFILLF